MTEPTIGDLLNQYFDQGRTGKHDEAAQRIRMAIAAELQKIRAEADDETYEIGKRDGYSEAVQQIDQLTGGDGEYRYCLGGADPDRHTPGPVEMIQRIVDRFEILNLLDEATKTGSDQPDDPIPSPQTTTAPASKADRGAVGQPLGSNRIEPALQASRDAMVPPQEQARGIAPVDNQPVNNGDCGD